MKIFTRLILLLSALLIGVSGGVDAQVSAYSFAQSSGSYTAVTGGTNFASLATSYIDDNSYTNNAIGFSFTYSGTAYTAFGINANGWITMGATAPSSSYVALSGGTSNNVIAAMNNDLIGRGSLLISRTSGSPILTVTSGDIGLIQVGDAVSGTGVTTGSTVVSKTATTVTISANATSTGTGSHLRFVSPSAGIRYVTSGTAPNRTLTVQWTGFQRYTTTGAFGELYNFQIILYETSNVIDVVYDVQGPTSTTTNTYQIGLRGASLADFNNRTTTTDWSATTAGAVNTATNTLSNTVKPASGQTYTWTAPSCVAPGGLTNSNITTTSASHSWNAAIPAPGVGYEWAVTTSATPPASGTATAGLTASSSGLTAGTQYYLHVRSECSVGVFSGWATASFSTLINGDICSIAIDLTTSINAGVVSGGNNTAASAGTNPFTITGGNTFNSWLTLEAAHRDMWYKVTPAVSGCFGFMSVSTLTSTFDTKIAIYESSCGSAVISGNDDFHGLANGYTSLTTAAVQSGMTYYIQVAGYSSTDFGDIVLDIVVTDIDGPVVHNGGNKTANFECTGSDGWTHYVNTTDGTVLLSVEKGTNNLGWIPMTSTSCTVSAGADAQNLGVLGCQSFYATTDNWWVMDRTWDFSPTTQPTSNVNIRTYYSGGDLADLVAVIPAITHDDLVHYKITSDEENLTANPCQATGTPANYTEYAANHGTCGGDGHYSQYAVSSFSGGGGGGGDGTGGGALPVELLSFEGTALEKENKLTWATASEENTEWHILERSINGQNNWVEIGRTRAAGTTADIQRYEMMDKAPVASAYYRLQSLDFDARFEYSNVIQIERKGGVGDMSIYPNPVSNDLNVDFTLDRAEEVTIQIVDLTGKLLSSEVMDAERGLNQRSMNVQQLQSGVYFITMISSNGNVTKRLMKN